MLLLAMTVFSTLGTRPPVKVPRCQTASNTVAFDECLGCERDKSLRALERYRLAARSKIARENPENGRLLGDFDAAQTAWVAYQKAECGAVYTLWQNGTIRGAMSLRCDIRLTQLRTHQLWSTWLVDENGPAPSLPEPVVETGS